MNMVCGRIEGRGLLTADTMGSWGEHTPSRKKNAYTTSSRNKAGARGNNVESQNRVFVAGCKRRFELYGKINNALNQDPPMIADGSTLKALAAASQIYDRIGRVFGIGIRYRW